MAGCDTQEFLNMTVGQGCSHFFSVQDTYKINKSK